MKDQVQNIKSSTQTIWIDIYKVQKHIDCKKHRDSKNLHNCSYSQLIVNRIHDLLKNAFFFSFFFERIQQKSS